MAGLILGGVAFNGFEIPNTINFGGKHHAVVHKLVGGNRVIDAMGGVPDQISWQGRFRGRSAIGRASQIDQMRISGNQVDLAWLSLFRSVVVVGFKANTEKAYEVPYEIQCEVVNENAGFLGGFFQTIDSMIGVDLGAATSFSGGAPSTVPIVSTLNASLAALGSFVGATAATRVAGAQAANTASVALQSSFDAEENQLGQTAPTGDPSLIAAWLVNQVTVGLSHSSTADVLAYVKRIGSNIAAVKA